MNKIRFKHRYYIYIILLTLNSPAYASNSGEQIYMNNCFTCHGDDGQGEMPGVADLTKNQGWRNIPAKKLLKQLKNGITKPGASINMPPKGGNPDLNDNDLMSAIIYMRKNFIK